MGRAVRIMVVAVLGIASMASLAIAATWPERPIQLVVPFPAGGGVDVMARPFAEALADLLHQPVVVVPKPGASGTIGSALVAMARPDGYTLLFTPNGPITVQPHVLPDLAYKPESFVPLCQVLAVQYVLAVRPDSRFRTLGELIEAAHAKPGTVSYGFGGVATAPHLAIAQLAIAAKLDMLSVPFRDDPQAVLALKAGEIDSAMLNVGIARAQGFRPLVTFAEARQPEIAATPTARELGFAVSSSAFGGLFAPRGLPADIRDRLQEACEKAVGDERYRRAAQTASQQAIFADGATFGRLLADDFATKGDVVRRAGIKAP